MTVQHTGLPDSQVWCFGVTRESRTVSNDQAAGNRPGPQAGSLVRGTIRGSSTSINLTLARRHNFLFGPFIVMCLGALLSLLVIWSSDARDRVSALPLKRKLWFWALAIGWSVIVLVGVYSAAYEAKPTFGTSGDYFILLTAAAGAAGLAVVVNLVRAASRASAGTALSVRVT